jgi:hypothetical protein
VIDKAFQLGFSGWLDLHGHPRNGYLPHQTQQAMQDVISK